MWRIRHKTVKKHFKKIAIILGYLNLDKPMTLTKRAIINGGIFSFILAAIGLYQGETFFTAALVWLFAWIIMTGAFWFSYQFTQSKTDKKELSRNEKLNQKE